MMTRDKCAHPDLDCMYDAESREYYPMHNLCNECLFYLADACAIDVPPNPEHAHDGPCDDDCDYNLTDAQRAFIIRAIDHDDTHAKFIVYRVDVTPYQLVARYDIDDDANATDVAIARVIRDLANNDPNPEIDAVSNDHTIIVTLHASFQICRDDVAPLDADDMYR